MHTTLETMHHLRAARYLLSVKQIEIAQTAGISHEMLIRIERAVPDIPSSALDRVQVTLERLGIMFFPLPEAGTLGLARRKTEREKAVHSTETIFERRRTLRAARALVQLTQAELAEKANLTRETIVRVEAGRSSAYAVDVVTNTLEKEGAVFIAATDEHWSGIAVNRRKVSQVR